MEIKTKISTPSMPNFILLETPIGKRDQGFVNKPSIPVEELTEEQAIEYGELMKETFINHWKKKKSQQNIN